jgi:hypothetical protein
MAQKPKDQDSRDSQNYKGKQAGRHRAADHIFSDPWQKPIRGFDAEFSENLNSLLTENPSRMKPDREEQ